MQRLGLIFVVAIGIWGCGSDDSPDEGEPFDGQAGVQPSGQDTTDRLTTGVRLQDEWVTSALEQQEAHAAIRSKLQAVVDVHSTNVTPAAVMADLFDRAGVAWRLDRDALEYEGVNLDDQKSAVTLQLDAVPIEAVLDLVCRTPMLVWEIRDGQVVVTTESALHERSDNVAVFSLAQLVASSRIETPRPPNPNAHRQTRDPAEVVAESVADLLTMLPGHHWKVVDGEGGRIETVRGHLVVRATYRAVVDVGQMLAVLELGAAGRLSGGSLSVRRPGYRFEADEAVRSVLLKTVGAVQLENQPLNEVLKQLAARLGVQIWLDEADLQDEGLQVTTAVTLVSGGDLQARILLEQLLDPISLTYVVDEGLLKVTTLVAAEEWLVMRVYDVGDLRRLGVSEAKLISLLESMTAGPWEELEGTGGTMGFFSTNLMCVAQMPAVHDQIASLLARLRKTLNGDR